MSSSKFHRILIFVLILFNSAMISAQTDSLSKSKIEWEVFPIINYDSDAGFGYGGKGFLYNILDINESFDLTIYNSTKGERWYRFVFSYPDRQRRQGNKYPFALDLIFDYDKWIDYKYHSTEYQYETGKVVNAVESYIREPIELTLMISRGYLKDFVAELGFRFRNISCYGFDSSGVLITLFPSEIKYLSIVFNFRLDTRTNFNNPLDGFVIEIDNEYSPDILKRNHSFYKFGILAQHYFTVLKPDFVWANRISFETTSDEYYQLKLSLGGNNSMRGMPQDRYLSNVVFLVNSELRYPIWKRLGGIAGVDIGSTNFLCEDNFWEKDPDWILNPVLGLRYYMDNFIVRFDVGFGSETTGVYFNFGHIF